MSFTCEPWKLISPSWSVKTFGWKIVTSGHRKSFHVHRNWITASVASAGSDSGRTIRNNTVSREAPSIRAASSSSIGSVRKNCVSRKIPNTFARLGTISAPRVSIRCISFTIKNVGMITTWMGIISVASRKK